MDPASSNKPATRKKSIWPMFAAVLVFFLLFAAAVQWMLSAGNRAAFDEEAIRAGQRYEILKKVTADNAALTTGYAWVDRAKGVVRIPVDRAMELAVAKLSSQGEPKPAYAVDPSVPMGAANKPGGLAAPAPTPPPFGSAAAAAAIQTIAPASEPAAPQTTGEVGP